MKFKGPLVEGTILSRYKRFMVDVKIADNQIVTAHLANTGSMATCWEKGWPVLLSESDNPRRKLKYSLEMTNNGNTWIGVNTMLTNKLVVEAIEQRVIKEFNGYRAIYSEVPVFGSRIDLLLKDKRGDGCYVEIKNVTLKEEENEAAFPDAVTTRGQKHIRELVTLRKQGFRAVMFYVVQREDVTAFAPARRVDPVYSDLLFEAMDEGVEVLVYRCILNKKEICIDRRIPLREPQ